MEILEFIFISNTDNTVLKFSSPKDAIRHFTSKGYGMHNWRIKVILTEFDMNGNNSCQINLALFNYFTDNWIEK